MAFQGVSLEVIPMLKEALQIMEEETIPNFAKVRDEVVEAAEYTGIPNLISGAKAQAESAGLVYNSLVQCKEAIENYVNYYGKIARATGAE